MTLTEFLLARITEDEQNFHDAAEAEVERVGDEGDMTREEVEAYWLRREEGRAVTGWPRWLAECEAKRRIVGRYTGLNRETTLDRRAIFNAEGEAHALWYALQMLALPYADHPDYHEEWRP